MYNTLRTIIFLVSSIIAYLVYPLIQQATYFLVDTTLAGRIAENYLIEIYSGLVLIFIVLTFAALQAIIRQVLLYRHSTSNSIMSFPITFFSATDRSIYYIVPFLAYLLPLFRTVNAREVLLIRIILFAITLSVFYFVLEFSKKHTKVFFVKEGLVVKGIDLRLNLPLPSPFINTTGFYPYTRFEHYSMTDSKVEFQLPAESGRITFEFEPDEKENLKQFLMMMNVPQGICHRDE
ncbi:hypothetical protein [Alkaliphilus hydrothermalis]|uniref:DUF5673 domain-containing protein n=1 Tax=Alkaliphilus hydrothermalis TaxID=1482730 RepID=A0ABS2NMS6_9FIRM|nr:hypothetical protein [Alkaliphilus hydrothermalis]MBM7614233.1 hypothetical protein [Alkaliphilus hydrothermalis]